MKPINALLRRRRPIRKKHVTDYALCYAYKQTKINDYSYEYPDQNGCVDITQDPTKIANYNECDDQQTDRACILRLQGMLQKFSDMDQNLLDRDDEDRNEYQNRLRNMVVYTRQKSDFYSKLFERCDKEESML